MPSDSDAPRHVKPRSPLYDAERVDFKLCDVRDALTQAPGEHCGGVWMSGHGEARRPNVAVTTRAPSMTRAAADAIVAKAGLTEHVAFVAAVWGLAEPEAGRERSTRSPKAFSRIVPRSFVPRVLTSRATS
jgi:hypothetical protein